MQSIEVDNKTKWAYTRQDPIGVCGQMYVLLRVSIFALVIGLTNVVASFLTPILQYSVELPYRDVVRVFSYLVMRCSLVTVRLPNR